MALKPLSEHQRFIVRLKKKMKEIDLLVRDYEAILYDDDDEPPPEKIFMRKANGEMVEIKTSGGRHG